jgi:DNA-binding CsgD family transcriptional regulator
LDKAQEPNYLELINELTRELTRTGVNAEALCQFLVVKTLAFLDPVGAYFNKLHPDGFVRSICACGMPAEAQKSWEALPFSEEVPGHDAMRSEKMIWLADSSDWLNQYPDLAKYMLIDQLNTFITIPIDVPGAAVASIGIMSKKIHRQNKEVISFLWTVGGLISLFFSTNGDKDSTEHLTSRQLEILEYMRDSYTNPEIAKELGFSESTIRHETIKIYEVLKVSGRREAINTAINQNLIKNSAETA